MKITKTTYICKLQKEVQNKIQKQFELLGVTKENIITAMDGRLCDIESLEIEIEKDEIYCIFLYNDFNEWLYQMESSGIKKNDAKIIYDRNISENKIIEANNIIIEFAEI